MRLIGYHSQGLFVFAHRGEDPRVGVSVHTPMGCVTTYVGSVPRPKSGGRIFRWVLIFFRKDEARSRRQLNVSVHL